MSTAENIRHESAHPVGGAAGEAAAAPPALSERSIVAITAVGHFLCHFSETMYGAVMVGVMLQFHLDKPAAASLGTLGYVLLGVGALPVGVWADAWGPTRVFRVYFAGMVVSALLVAVSPNVLWLVAALTFLGLTASIYHPVGLSMISLGVRSRGTAMGVNGVVGNFGIALGPALGTLLRDPGHWRIAYLTVAAVSLAAAVYYWWLSRSAVGLAYHHMTRPGTVEIDRPAGGADAARGSRWPLVLLYGAMLMAGFNYRCLMTALPTFLSGEQTSGGALTAGAVAVFLSLIIGAVGQLAGGWAADRFGARWVYPLLIGLLAVTSIVVAHAPTMLFAFVSSCFLAVFLFGQQPVENSVLAEKTSRGRRSLSYATKFALTFGIGALGAPVVGFVWRELGMAAVFYLIAASATVMFILAVSALWLVRTADGEMLCEG